jgi:hypothetical protein
MDSASLLKLAPSEGIFTGNSGYWLRKEQQNGTILLMHRKPKEDQDAK